MPETNWWEKVSPYLDQALEMTDAERAVWLASLREQDAELASHLETLLKEHHLLVEERFLEQSPLPATLETTLAGQTLGPYTLVSPISEGGMGSVWLAQRSDGRFQRRAAVKFLRASLFGRGGAERFRREGAILARLAHPHIAQLLDAGVSASGQPYYVLEYVEGQNIVEYADAHGLDVEARVRLFLDVLGAIEHAHSNLIVHRDIKPSNVLVSGEGEVKLLDFGIAKLLEDEGGSAAATELTREGGRALTPQYAAPEQITGGLVNTATDVYACGVLLYELLTGQHPLGPGPHSTADIVKAITEMDAPRLSEAPTMGRAGDDAGRAAAHRATTPEKLRRQLRGDLETIVAKALKKEPAERYASAAAMADDLRRYLSSEPIRARPDTFAYRANKFARRNRVVLVLAALALTGSAAGAVSTWIQARTARAQRDFALRQLARAEALNDLNSFVLSDAAPSGKPLAIKDLIARSEHIVEQQKGRNDAARVELLISIGKQYGVLDDQTASFRLLSQAYDLSRQLPDPSVRARASCAMADSLANNEKPRAEALLREGLAELPDKPEFVLDRVDCLLSGSEMATNQGFYEEAIARAQSAQRLLEQSPVKEDSLELNASIDLTEAYRIAGRLRDTIAAYEQASARLASLGRDDSRTGAELQEGWAITLDDLGLPREAGIHYRRAIEINQTDASNQSVPLQTLVNYARNLQELGGLDEAAKLAESAYDKGQQTQQVNIISQALFVRSRIYREQGDLNRAEEMLEQAEPQLQRSLPPGHYAFASLDLEKALVAKARGELPAALSMINQGFALVENASQSGRQGYYPLFPHLLVARSGVVLGLHRPVDAEADARRAVKLFQEVAGQGAYSSFLGRAELALGRALEAQGKHAEARDAFRSAANHLQNTLGPQHPDTKAALKFAQL